MARIPISVTTSGHFNKTTAYLNRLKGFQIQTILNRYGSAGVAALEAATPKDTGVTAGSWYYTVGTKDNRYWIDFHNSSMTPNGIPIVILIQYGHGTRNGGYVVGRDFINPALASIFESIKNDAWKEVSSL